MNSSYIRSYLRDLIGKTPEEATAFLQSSPGSFLFRSMRVVEDIHYNPKTHDLAKPDDFVEGRTTIKVVGQYIVDCEYEYGSGFEAVYLKPEPPKRKGEKWPKVKLLDPEVVFQIDAPQKLGGVVRRDIECNMRPPSRGWYIKEFIAIGIVNPRSIAIGKRKAEPVIKRPTVSPLFYELPW